MTTFTRRSFFGLGVKVSVVGAAAWTLTACGQKQEKAASTACADASNLTSSEQSLRASTHYVEQSSDQAKTCAGCQFFTAAEDGGGCGHCQIFNGAANPRGHCDSWAAKQA